MQNKRGGPGRGQGRKATDGATGLVQVAVRVTAPQRIKLAALGGSVWMRRQIDAAELTEAPAADPATPAG